MKKLVLFAATLMISAASFACDLNRSNVGILDNTKASSVASAPVQSTSSTDAATK